jgi:hypothetical protein
MSEQDISSTKDLATSASTIRETAKWLITAFAAIGVVLIAGSQLSNIGNVKKASTLLLAISSVVFSLIGIGIAIWFSVNVMTPGLLTLSELVNGKRKKPRTYWDNLRLKDVRDWINNDNKEILKRAVNVKDLRDQYSKHLDLRYSTLNELKADPRGPNRDKYDLAEAESQELDNIVHQVLAIASYEDLRRYFRATRKFIFAGGLIAAIGVLGFSLTVKQTPEKEHFQLPTIVQVSLFEEGKIFLAKELGENCFLRDTSNIKVIAISEKDNTWDVLTIPTGSCDKSLRLQVKDTVGTVYAQNSVPTPKTK